MSSTKRVYHDYALITEKDINTLLHRGEGTRSSGSGSGLNQKRDTSFPEKLHYVLTEMEKSGQQHIASWQSHGRCFIVHDQASFTKQILPCWFRMSKFASFQRQLNIYNFTRITTGADKGGYYHELFLRNKLFLTTHITRSKLKGEGPRKSVREDDLPDLYAFPSLTAHGPANGHASTSNPNTAHVFQDRKPVSQLLPGRAEQDSRLPMALRWDSADSSRRAQQESRVNSSVPVTTQQLLHQSNLFAGTTTSISGISSVLAKPFGGQQLQQSSLQQHLLSLSNILAESARDRLLAEATSRVLYAPHAATPLPDRLSLQTSSGRGNSSGLLLPPLQSCLPLNNITMLDRSDSVIAREQRRKSLLQSNQSRNYLKVHPQATSQLPFLWQGAASSTAQPDNKAFDPEEPH